jgi:hypothetical protein
LTVTPVKPRVGTIFFCSSAILPPSISQRRWFVRHARALTPVTGGSMEAQSMKSAIAKTNNSDEKCNADAQTTGSRLPCGHHWTISDAYLR